MRAAGDNAHARIKVIDASERLLRKGDKHSPIHKVAQRAWALPKMLHIVRYALFQKPDVPLD